MYIYEIEVVWKEREDEVPVLKRTYYVETDMDFDKIARSVEASLNFISKIKEIGNE